MSVSTSLLACWLLCALEDDLAHVIHRHPEVCLSVITADLSAPSIVHISSVAAHCAVFTSKASYAATEAITQSITTE